jgi:glycosyltransferase involved in cell wall biosynthesis
VSAPGAIQSLAFVCPRYAAGGTVGGAETLLRELARRAARAGRRVAFLTTCAKSHFTWANEIEPGARRDGDLEVRYFPVDADRDAERFLRIQGEIDRRAGVSRADEEAWIANSVNSRALCDHLRERGGDYDRIVLGPYLFGVTWRAAQIHPSKSFLVPCLHDEPFAYLSIMTDLFRAVHGCLFNSEPERDLAARLYGAGGARGLVVGMGLDPFEADPSAYAARRGLAAPYVAYAGRRESAKGTPLLVDYLDAFRARTGRDIRLVVTGSGPIDARPFVIDEGFVSEADKHAIMAGARAFVHPSVMESFGIVLLESFLAGTPGLVHAGGAVLRWQCERSGAGLWFRHYPDFEELLVRLLDDDALRASLGARGRDYVRREYAWDAVERRFFQALEEESPKDEG